MPLPRVTEMAHDLVARVLRPGDHAVDATVGNGHDTRFLAEIVGKSGRVDGFDIQPGAITSARSRIAGYDHVRLHCLGHERMAEVVSGPVMAIMFNLGYFPSGDKCIATGPRTTLPALDAGLGLLAVGGILCVVVYPGHEGGRDEALAVEAWFGDLDPARCPVVRYGPACRVLKQEPPFLLAMTRDR